MAFQIRIFSTIAVFLLVTWMFLSDAQAQVTFSRDWNPGKRGENPDFHNAMKTASAVCHLLINQVRQLATCDNRDEIEPGANNIFGGRR
nr:adipokinetic hormone [Zophobas atratus]